MFFQSWYGSVFLKYSWFLFGLYLSFIPQCPFFPYSFPHSSLSLLHEKCKLTLLMLLHRGQRSLLCACLPLSAQKSVHVSHGSSMLFQVIINSDFPPRVGLLFIYIHSQRNQFFWNGQFLLRDNPDFKIFSNKLYKQEVDKHFRTMNFMRNCCVQSRYTHLPPHLPFWSVVEWSDHHPYVIPECTHSADIHFLLRPLAFAHVLAVWVCLF